MDINKKSRAELKAYFVKNAIPTETNFRDFIDAMPNQKDDGLTKSAGSPLCIEAGNTGEQPIIQLYESFPTAPAPNWVVSLLPGTTAGTKTTGRGFSIGNGAGAANAKLFIEQATGNLAIGAVDPAGFTLNVGGTLNVAGAVTLNGSVAAAAGQVLNLNSPINANSSLTVASGQTFNANGPLNANSSLTVAKGQTLNANGPVNAYAGASVSGGLLTASAGATINGSLLTANVGATINGGLLNANAGATISGTMTAGIVTFPPPPGDPAPVITARTVPVGQGNANESTELILFHSNDNDNGYGPDYITLRAPGLRFQTYNDGTVNSIDNNAGSNTRMYIDPQGRTTTYGSLTVGTTTAPQTLAVTGASTLTGPMTGAPNDYAHAQYTLSGGGVVTWGGPGGRLKWTQRFICISAERGTTFLTGHMDIGPSANGLAVVQDWDNAARSSTADGVILNDWEALYAVHPPGGDYNAVTLRITNWNNGNFKAPSNWILIAASNPENNTIKLGTGQIVAANSTLNKSGLVPSGTIMLWYRDGTNSIPDGWALCDGNNGTPDLRDRFVVGAGGSYQVHWTGGEALHTLTVDEMPSHAHQALASGIDDRNFSGDNTLNGEKIPFARSDANMADLNSTRNTGGGKAHENRPPYHALYYIMKL